MNPPGDQVTPAAVLSCRFVPLSLLPAMLDVSRQRVWAWAQGQRVFHFRGWALVEVAAVEAWKWDRDRQASSVSLSGEPATGRPEAGASIQNH